MSQSWWHLSVRIGAACIDAVGNFLIERGSSGVVLKRGRVEAYFPDSGNVKNLRKAIDRYVAAVAKLQGGRTRAQLTWQLTRPEDWQHAWKRFIKPRRVGRLFWVTPPWLVAPRFRRRQVITIEPGMAFGTGTHATTRGCLEFLERVAALLPPARLTGLDVGTGSGILAIALAKLGAKKICAIDNDPVALQVARDNLAINGAADKVHLSTASLAQIKRKFPLVVANLTAETIVQLAAGIERRVGPGGYLILSGILFPQANSVLRCFAPRFRVIERKRASEWVTLLLRRR